jgi:hypothetical protein
MFAGSMIASEVVGCEAGVLGDAGEHPWPQFVAVMKREGDVLPPVAGERAMGSGLPLNDPPYPQERGQYT